MLNRLLYQCLFTLILFYILSTSFALSQSNQIKIVGSSTLYPFVTMVAEEFGRISHYQTPVIETNGTGGGFQLFCRSFTMNTPDIVNASRVMKKSERILCRKNGISEIVEIKLGYDGIVIVNSLQSIKFSLTKKQIFLALAKKIPFKGKIVQNFYTKWNQISTSLPNMNIKIYGPPPTSGTRDAFVQLVMIDVCMKLKEFVNQYSSITERKSICSLLREDGKFINAGENDNLMIAKIVHNKEAFSILGYSFLKHNSFLIQGSAINGIEPTNENIHRKYYSLTRPLFLYINKQDLDHKPGLKEFLIEITSNDAIGPLGYVTREGLIPMDSKELLVIQQLVSRL